MSRHTARAAIAAAGAVIAALALAGCGQGFSSGGSSGSASGLTSSKKPLTLMIGSSGDAETKAVQDAAAAWSKKSGVDVTVVPATNLSQQLSQGFAAGSPPDVFYLSTLSEVLDRIPGSLRDAIEVVLVSDDHSTMWGA